MNGDDIPTSDILDSTGSTQTGGPRARHRSGVVVGAVATVAVAVGLLAGLHGHGLPISKAAGADSVPVGAPRSLLVHEQVPSWRPSESATVVGGYAGSLTHQQVPSWSPTAPALTATYREQVPAGP